MRNRISKIFLGITILAIAVVALFYFWAFYPYIPLTVNNAPIPIRPPEVTTGPNTTVIATLSACKHMDITPVVTRSIVGVNSVLATPSYTGAIHSTGCTTLDQAIIVPQFTPAGVYHVHWHVAYRVNPIRTVVVTYNSQNFTIGKTP